MAASTRVLFFLAICATTTLPALADEPQELAAAKIAFHWLENAPIAEVTREEGFRTTCGDELSYAHLTPILTNEHVASAVLSEHDFSSAGIRGAQFSVKLHLTPEARQTLIDSLGDAPDGVLAIFVENRYWGAGYFRTESASTFVPMAGYLTSRADAQRIVDACE